jgi:hypothetical protein
MSQEKTQIFRGDDAPEMGFADTEETAPVRRPSGPVDQRALSDSKEGQQGERREMRDAQGEAELRRMDDASGGEAEQRRMLDATDGLTDQRRTDDAEGASEQRVMRDADGPSEQRAMHDADGLSELRQLHDHKAAVPGEISGKAEVQLNFNDDEPEPEPVAATPEPAKPVVEPPSPQDDADLTFKVERDATPWALSIHLEERIANLGMVTAKVNEQLDALEASTKRLGKRVGK